MNDDETRTRAGAATGARRRGRPSAPVLSRPRITQAAIALVESDGYGVLTMAGLARELRVAPSALYNHVESRAEVLRWIQDHVNSRIDVSGFATAPWDEALATWARSYRDAYAHHAPLVPLIAVAPITGAPHTIAMYEQVAAGLQAGGWSPDRISSVIVAVESFVLGSALDLEAPADIFDVGELADQAPAFARAVVAHGPDRATAAFELGLKALVDGLRANLA